MTCIIRKEKEQDRAAVKDINTISFGSPAEADLVRALQSQGYEVVSLVAEVDQQIVGHILFSRVLVVSENKTWTALSLAPMCVLPEYRRQGIGTRLIAAGLEACRAQGHSAIVVLGDPAYYSRFGFSSELALGLESPYSNYGGWMALELTPGVLAGRPGHVEYPPPFQALVGTETAH
ncbi:GNAT family N-acetyltransferase [Rubinisphaera margarita]|uniref:GNAT family N-acetyltransferase n=1 Tax=Rubinisphaera margarita TaxID=2909586 RepID=UPI001EE8924E|nr:N-acetyltransferase [Rubinisphaera margarita]MCG6154248.1 N-acetyltransferase [Rubinisphaera margarita]